MLSENECISVANIEKALFPFHIWLANIYVRQWLSFFLFNSHSYLQRIITFSNAIQLNVLSLPFPDPLLSDVLPDPIDQNPQQGDEDTNNKETNVFKYLLPIQKNVVDGDRDYE